MLLMANGLFGTEELVRTTHAAFNALGALFWLGLAIVLLARHDRLSERSRRVNAVAVPALVAFAATDIIEIVTGSWFQPLGLLVLNALCIGVLLPCLWYSARQARQAKRRRRKAGEACHGIASDISDSSIALVSGDDDNEYPTPCLTAAERARAP